MALVMFIPTTIASSWRFSYLTPEKAIPLWLSVKLFLAAGSLNLVLPSKMGDLFKVFFVRRKVGLPDSLLFCLVVFEKSLDLAALSLLCLIGILLHPSGDPFLVWVLFVGNLALVTLIALLVFSPKAASLIFRLFSRIPKLGGKFVTLGQSWDNLQNYLASIPHGRTIAVTVFCGHMALAPAADLAVYAGPGA